MRSTPCSLSRSRERQAAIGPLAGSEGRSSQNRASFPRRRTAFERHRGDRALCSLLASSVPYLAAAAGRHIVDEELRWRHPDVS